jgi:hypothetical protein
VRSAEEVRSTQHLLSFDFVAALLSVLLAGWVMAVLSWLLDAADSTLARITFVYLATFLIGAAPLHTVYRARPRS